MVFFININCHRRVAHLQSFKFRSIRYSEPDRVDLAAAFGANIDERELMVMGTSSSMSSSSLTPTGTSQPKNPISLRLYKVLSTNFDDLATREALGTLSDLYGADSVETYPGEYASKARRNLRRDMENKLAESSHHFVKALGEVDLVRFSCPLVALQCSR